MSAEDIIAESKKRAAEMAKAEAEKTSDTSATRAGVSQFLSTATGGLGDYMELLTRKMRGDDIQWGDIDRVRADMAQLHDAHPGAALAGKIGGTAAQALPVGRALQGLGWLAKAPGIVGGVKSGVQIGAGVGAFNEGARQLDRLGSEDRAAEDFNPLMSGGRILKEGVLGGVGGAVGGAVGNLATKGAGLIANRISEPYSEAAINATLAAQKIAEQMGLRGAAKLAPQEAMRAVKDPALRAELAEGAAGLEGLAVKAGRDFQTVGTRKGQGMLPAEAAAKPARDAVLTSAEAGVGSAEKAAAQAATLQDLAQTARAGMAKQPLIPAAEWEILGNPALRALRTQLVNDARGPIADALKTGPTLRGAPYTAREATSIARQRVPAQRVDAVERMLENAPTPAIADATRGVLARQSPVFKAADDAALATQGARANVSARQSNLAELDNILAGPLGRQNANIGQPASRGGTGILGFNVASLLKDIGRTVADAAENTATAKAGRKLYADPLEEILRQMGRRTAAQRRTQAIVYPALGGALGNAGLSLD